MSEVATAQLLASGILISETLKKEAVAAAKTPSEILVEQITSDPRLQVKADEIIKVAATLCMDAKSSVKITDDVLEKIIFSVTTLCFKRSRGLPH